MEATMASIQAQHDYLTLLKRDVRAAWFSACEVDHIDPMSTFVVFTNTPEAAAYNELMGLFLKAKRAYFQQSKRNAARRAKHAAYKDCGLNRVEGGLYE
jgi:hypothetical protein